MPSTKKKKIGNILLTVCSFLIPLLLVEGVCLFLNRADGVTLRFFFQKPKQYQILAQGDRFSGIDSLLGYTRGDDFFHKSTSEQVELKDGFAVVRSSFGLTSFAKDGFVFHPVTEQEIPRDTFSIAALPRPFILILGGSTSQSLRANNIPSWPEHLALLLQEKNRQGTIINGALSGYASNQELFILIRDGLRLKPDLVISYHGVNEVWHRKSAHPLTVPYLHTTLERAVRSNALKSPVLPNTVYRVSAMTKRGNRSLSVTEGLPSEQSHAQSFSAYTRYMTSLLHGEGVQHITLLQPFALTGIHAEKIEKQDPETIDSQDSAFPPIALHTLDMYAELMEMQQNGQLPMQDFTHVFDDLEAGGEPVYYDWCHVNSFANKHVAQKIYDAFLHNFF